MSLSRESEIKAITKSEFKRIVKLGVRATAFKHLEATNLSHDKVRHIERTDMKKSQELSGFRQEAKVSSIQFKGIRICSQLMRFLR